MSVPGKHDDEPTTEIQALTFAQWVEAKSNLVTWKIEEARLRAELEDQLGDLTAGTVYGRKVVTFRPKTTYAVKAIQRDYPDLTQHYMRPQATESFDIDMFAMTHPEIVEKYRVREFRLAVDLSQEEDHG